MTLSLRDATVDDSSIIAGFVRALAVYEKLLHEAVATDADFARVIGSGISPALIAEWDGQPVGYAMWYYTFSTFTGRTEIYLEDVFVLPEHRNHGIGRAIFRDLARRAMALGCQRMEWSVLDWNQTAIDFYRSIGAKPMDEWTKQRLDQPAIAALAA